MNKFYDDINKVKLDQRLIRSSLMDGLDIPHPHWRHQFGPSYNKFVYSGF